MRSAFLYLLSTHPMLHLCRGAVLHSVQRLVASRKGFAAILPPLGITKSPLHAITKSKGRQQSWDAALQCRRSVVTHSTKQTENILVVHPRQRPLEHLHETLRLVETLTGRYLCQPLRQAGASVSFVTHAAALPPFRLLMPSPGAGTRQPEEGQQRHLHWARRCQEGGCHLPGDGGHHQVSRCWQEPISRQCLQCLRRCCCMLPSESSIILARRLT